MNDDASQAPPPVALADTESLPALSDGVAPEHFGRIMRELGFRATLTEEGGSAVVIRSATQGVGFLVMFGGLSPRGAPWRSDLTFQCWLNVSGTLPETTVSSWNQGKRFARLFWQGSRLVLAMDVLIAGGVSLAHLRAQCDLWNRLVGDLLLHLRQSLPVALPVGTPQATAPQPT